MFDFAHRLHQHIQRSLQSNDMFTVSEVVANLPSPFSMMYELYHGHALSTENSDCLPQIENIVHFNDIDQVVSKTNAAVMTCNKHNVAIVKKQEASLFVVFDSLPCAIHLVEESSLCDCLRMIFGSIFEFNLFIFEFL